MANPVSHTDYYGLFVGIDDALFAGGGALVGVVGQGVGDLISGRFSGPGMYAAAALGGAAGGEALLYTGNPLIAGGVGGVLTNLVNQGLAITAGNQSSISWSGVLADTSLGILSGLVPGPGKLLPGITSGRGSYSAIAKQITTKLANGQIRNVSSRTVAKSILSQLVEGLPGSGAATVAGIPISSYLNNGCQ